MANSDKIPDSFKKLMYEAYKFNMKLYGKDILLYEVWLKEVQNVKIKQS